MGPSIRPSAVQLQVCGDVECSAGAGALGKEWVQLYHLFLYCLTSGE